MARARTRKPNESALRANTAATSMLAISTPATAGPTARARFMLMPPSAEAAGSWERGTSSGIRACQAGMVRVWAQPSRNVNVSSSAGVVLPAAVRAARAPAMSSAAVCTAMMSRRRSNTSANTPAGRARKNTGDMLAVWTRATRVSAAGWSTSSHCAPTVCIQVPIRLPSWASHSTRKILIRSGAHADSMAPPPHGVGYRRAVSSWSTSWRRRWPSRSPPGPARRRRWWRRGRCGPARAGR